MARHHIGDSLTDHHYATVILRLLLDHDGRLLRGELVDVPGVHAERFRGFDGLTQTMQSWLERQERNATLDHDSEQ